MVIYHNPELRMFLKQTIFRTKHPKPGSHKKKLSRLLKKLVKEEKAKHGNLVCLRLWRILITVVTHRASIKGKMFFKSTKPEGNPKNL